MTNYYPAWNRTVSGLYQNHTVTAAKVNVTKCTLYNASYNVDYVFQNSDQTIRVSALRLLDTVGLYGPNASSKSVNFATYFDHHKPPHLPLDAQVYIIMMTAFGKLLVGYSSWQRVATLTSQQMINIDWTRGPADEAGLESLFQNMTLSMVSQNLFRKPRSSTKPVPVTVTTYPNTYQYVQWELLTAYGAALLLSLSCACLGSYAIFANHASYQNTFSSFLRATSGHEIQSKMRSDEDGADPLPKDLAKAKIRLGRAEGKLD